MEFVLEKKAKASGGDRYKCVDNPKFVIYIPQTISRKEGNVHAKLTVTIDSKEDTIDSKEDTIDSKEDTIDMKEVKDSD